MRAMLVVMVLAGLCFGRGRSDIDSWNGWLDTAAIAGTITGDSVVYSAPFILTDGLNTRWVVRIDDTTNAGLTTDSISGVFGYQTGSITTNSSAVKDTAWDRLISLDSMTTTDLKNGSALANKGTMDSTGTITRGTRLLDTTQVSGYAVYTRNFAPEWDELIRAWWRPTSANNKAALKIIVTNHRKLYSEVRVK